MTESVARSNQGESGLDESRAEGRVGRRSQRVRSAATRAALIAAARASFAKVGYLATATPDLVALTSVTRGALYHHFGDKEGLFEAVFLEIDEELRRRARAVAASTSGNLWDKLLAALATYLRQRADSREVQRIVLIDAPAVFGWERWRELQTPMLEDLAQVFQILMDQGVIAERPPEPLAQLAIAALNEAALSIAHSPSPQEELARQTDALLALLGGLRVDRGAVA